MVSQDHAAKSEAGPGALRAASTRAPNGDDVALQFLEDLGRGFIVSSVREHNVPVIAMGGAMPSADGNHARPGPVAVIHETCIAALLIRQKYAVTVTVVSIRSKLKRIDIDFGDITVSYPADGVGGDIANIVQARVAKFKVFAFEKLHRRFGGTGVVSDAA